MHVLLEIKSRQICVWTSLMVKKNAPFIQVTELYAALPYLANGLINGQN